MTLNYMFTLGPLDSYVDKFPGKTFNLNDVQDFLSDLFFLFGGVVLRGGKFLRQNTWPRNSRQYLGDKKPFNSE